MNIQDFFEKYPISMARFAKYIGKDRQWLNTRLMEKVKIKPSDAVIINDGIKKLSKEMRANKIK